MDRMGRQREKMVSKKYTITPTHQLLIEQEQRRTHLSESAIVRKALDQFFNRNPPDRGTTRTKTGGGRAGNEDMEGQLPFGFGLD